MKRKAQPQGSGATSDADLEQQADEIAEREVRSRIANASDTPRPLSDALATISAMADEQLADLTEKLPVEAAKVPAVDVARGQKIQPEQVSAQDTVNPNTAEYWLDANTGLAWSHAVDFALYRLASPDERTDFRTSRADDYQKKEADYIGQYGAEYWEQWKAYLLGLWSRQDTLVYVRREYRQTKPSAIGTRDADVRMLDRIARLADVGGQDGSPHLAAAVNPETGRLAIAGNTGHNRIVSEDDQIIGSGRLVAALGLDEEDLAIDGHDPRLRQDAIKVRALLSGDYADIHNSPDLAPLAKILYENEDWHNVGENSNFVEHGEMILLETMLAWIRSNPRDPNNPVRVPIGGTKQPCQACSWAIEAFNDYIGNVQGYHVVTADTHGGLFVGWTMPKWLVNHEKAFPSVKAKVNKAGWWLKSESGRFVLKAKDDDSPGARMSYEPDSSDSEWEEIPKTNT